MRDILFIDYETFWGVKYSLRTQGMSYTDYILHDKFQIHGASVAINHDKPVFLRGHELTEFVEAARKKGMLMVCHNALFDGLITRFDLCMVFPAYFCTLAMLDAIYQGAISVGLDNAMIQLLDMQGKSDIIKRLKDVRTEDITNEQWTELAKYANYDLEATQRLYYEFAHLLPELEHKIMDIVLRMGLDPKLEFDETTLFEAVQEADDDRNARIASALALGTTEEELKGNNTFPTLLQRMGYEVPMKESPTVADKMIPALAKTDENFQAMLESSDEKLRALADGRLAVKSTQATTRAHRFKKLHIELACFVAAYNYARAHTWRVTGANKINPANLKRGSKLRKCIVARRGHVLGVADASQIECRGNGYLAGQQSLLDMFIAGIDPYNAMAEAIFEHPVDRKGNPDHYIKGFLGKTATLGLGFQMGGPRFQSEVKSKAKTELGIDLEISLDESYRIVNLYRETNWKIEKQWERCKRMLFTMVNNEGSTFRFADAELYIDGPTNKIWFPNGTWLYYPNLSYDGNSFTYVNKQGPHRYITKYIYGGLLCENIVQHFARNITSDHMVQIAERYPVVLHTYDENVAMIPEAEAEEGTQWMIDLMKVPPWWAKSLPLDAEGGWAKEYSK